MNEHIEKIKKLLDLSNSDNEHEASLAAQRAQALLVKHNLTMQQVDAVNLDDEYTEESIGEATVRRTKASKLINSLLIEYFFVSIIIKFDKRQYGEKFRAKREVFIGKKSNIEIAKYISLFLNRTFNDLWKEYKARTGADTKAKDAYFLGLYKGLSDQLKANQAKVEHEVGLVVVPDAGLKQYIKNSYTNLKSDKGMKFRSNDQATADGREQGRALNISRGLGDSSTKSNKFLK